MRYFVFLFSLVLTLMSCEHQPHWSDQLDNCLNDDEVALLYVASSRFEKILAKKFEGETKEELYQNFVKQVERANLIDEIYHELLIKETTKLLQASSLYEKIWQKSSKWVLNDGKGTGVYFINGFAEVPKCLAKSSDSNWLKTKVKELESYNHPAPSIIALEMIKELTPEDFKNPYNQFFIALSLCYTPAVAYYDKN